MVSGSAISITDEGFLAGVPSLSVLGTIAAPAVSLTADSMMIAGDVTDGGAGTVALIATLGTIGETGTLIAGTLTGSSTAGTSLTGATATTNRVAVLGNFFAPGFTLDDGANLTVTGALAGGPSATVLDHGTLTVASGGTVSATAISLTAGNIAIPGLVTDGGAGTATLVANLGTISEPGTLIAGTLSGSAAAAATFSGATPTTDQVAAVSSFTAAGFTLNDGSSLTVSGVLNGGPSVTVLDNGNVTIGVGGTVIAGAVGLIANNLAILGKLTDGGAGTVSLTANTGGISEPGTLIAGTLSGSSVGATSLTGATASANQVATLGNFTSFGFTLNDGHALAVNGTLNGGPGATVIDTGVLTIGGTVTASAVGLTAGNIAIPGVVTDGGSGSVSLTATAGSIGETGSLTAGTLTGGATASANLTGSNQVANLGNFTAASFSLNDGAALTVGGNLAATAVALDAPSISIPGAISAGSNGTVGLTATAGTIGEPGAITAGTLFGSAAGAAMFSGADQIATLGNFTANTINLSDGSNLAINGAVNGGPLANLTVAGTLTINGLLSANLVSLTTGGGIIIPGTLQDANSVTVNTGGSIVETGALIADLLTGNAAGTVSLTGNPAGTSNQVLQLGNFTAGSFSLNDGTSLLISGVLTAPYININTGAGAITFANGATIVTGGTPRPPGAINTYPSATTSTVGAFLTSAEFTQQGSSFDAGIGGGPNIVRVDVTGAGNINFDKNAGLFGPNTWLILGIDTGQATGSVFVQNLDVIRLGGSGSTTLTGSIGGLSGPEAAGAAGIQPGPNSNYRFNSCPIHSVNCVLLPTQGVPTANPLNDINFGSVFNPDEQDDLLLPIVSDQDY